MSRLYLKIVSPLLFVLGIMAFWQPDFYNLAYLDPWEGWLYFIGGGAGLIISWRHSDSANLHYTHSLGILSLLLVLLGLSLPNFKDIFHLEPAENVWHLLIGISGVLVGKLPTKNIPK